MKATVRFHTQLLRALMKSLSVATSAEIVETKGERMPFKVVFAKNGNVIAERPVVSLEGGRKLIANLLPLLQKHDD